MVDTFLTERFKVKGKETSVGTALGRLKMALDIVASQEDDPDHPVILNAIVQDEDRAKSLYQQSRIADNLLQADYSTAELSNVKDDFNVFKIIAPSATGVFNEIADILSDDAQEQALLEGEESKESQIRHQLFRMVQNHLDNANDYIRGIQAALMKHFPQRPSRGLE